MKKIGLILFIVMILAVGVNAQPPEGADAYERYKALKISYMTEKLELTPDEAQEFWPVYNEYERKRLEIQQSRRGEEAKIQENYATYSESDFKKLNSSIIELYVEEASLMEEYNDKFLKILPAKRVVMIGKLENDFRYDMIREYSKQKGDDD